MSDLWPAPAPAPARSTRVVSLPGSKSLTNRALVLAALADGPSVVRRAAALARHRAHGRGADRARVTGRDTGGDDWPVTPRPPARRADVDCGLAGTVMRFVPPVAGAGRRRGRLRRRPARAHPADGRILDALRALGVRVDDGGRGTLPFTVRGTGPCRGGTVVIDASASSQFVSALLLAGARVTTRA